MIDTKILRKKILDLAIQGKLVAQDSNDGSTDTLLKQLQVEKRNRISRGELVLPRYSLISEGRISTLNDSFQTGPLVLEPCSKATVMPFFV